MGDGQLDLVCPRPDCKSSDLALIALRGTPDSSTGRFVALIRQNPTDLIAVSLWFGEHVQV